MKAALGQRVVFSTLCSGSGVFVLDCNERCSAVLWRGEKEGVYGNVRSVIAAEVKAANWSGESCRVVGGGVGQARQFC